jgi:protein-S-isoprenylcysteine O-methyltransferase Ste14
MTDETLVMPTSELPPSERRRLNMKQCKRYIGASVWAVWSILTILQTVPSFFLYNQTGIPVLRYIGWIIWAVMCVFGLVPILALRRKGGVPEGKGYTHTTVLVDSGIYAIVRHPQYLAFMLLNLFLILIVQHWFITIIGLPAMALSYVIALDADRLGVEKFGDDYKRYMQTVPRVNALVGVIRLLRRSKREQKTAGSEEK